MKRRTLTALLCALVMPAANAQQAKMPAGYIQKVTDSQAILGQLKGNVDLYGVSFGSSEFQRGILRLLEQKAIKVRVMTTPQAANNFRPLKALGAQIYVLKANYTNSLIAVQNGPLIFVEKNGFQVIPDPANAAAAGQFLQQYWTVATRAP